MADLLFVPLLSCEGSVICHCRKVEDLRMDEEIVHPDAMLVDVFESKLSVLDSDIAPCQIQNNRTF
jgi:hypothetical protein